MGGKLIVFEGGDGLGKSTQVRALNHQLAALGYEATVVDFPRKSGSPIGELIAKYLRGEYGDVAPEFLSLAFAADRLVERDAIIDLLNAGRMVICDRYVLSNIAFQSSKIESPERRERLKKMISWLEYEVIKLPAPDLQIIFTASDAFYAEGQHLARSASGEREYLLGHRDIHESSFGLQRAVNDFFINCPEGRETIKVAVEDSSGVRRLVRDVQTEIFQRVSRASGLTSALLSDARIS